MQHGTAISIHAPREGGDGIPCPRWAAKPSFQSTPPARGATTFDIQVDDITGISIHAPREGGDLPVTVDRLIGIISIHAPREGGDIVECILSD